MLGLLWSENAQLCDASIISNNGESEAEGSTAVGLLPFSLDLSFSSSSLLQLLSVTSSRGPWGNRPWSSSIQLSCFSWEIQPLVHFQEPSGMLRFSLPSVYSSLTVISWASDSHTVYIPLTQHGRPLGISNSTSPQVSSLLPSPPSWTYSFSCVPIQETTTIIHPTAWAEIQGSLWTNLNQHDQHFCIQLLKTVHHSTAKCWKTKYDLKCCTYFWKKDSLELQQPFWTMRTERQPGILMALLNCHISPGTHLWNFT